MFHVKHRCLKCGKSPTQISLTLKNIPIGIKTLKSQFLLIYIGLKLGNDIISVLYYILQLYEFYLISHCLFLFMRDF